MCLAPLHSILPMPGMHHTFRQVRAAILLCLRRVPDLLLDLSLQAAALQPKVPLHLQVHVLSPVRLEVLHPCSTPEADAQLNTRSVWEGGSGGATATVVQRVVQLGRC